MVLLDAPHSCTEFCNIQNITTLSRNTCPILDVPLITAMFNFINTIFHSGMIQYQINQLTVDTTTVHGVTTLIKQHIDSLNSFASHFTSFVAHPIQYIQLHDSLESGIYLSICIGLICWALSVPTRKYSWVDKLWSIVPIIFTLHWSLTIPYANKPQHIIEYIQYIIYNQPRVILCVVLPLIWGTRLTYNFYRKGGYAFDAEDYRWVYVQKLPIIGHPLVWQPFNFIFIGIYQIMLLMLITTPAYIVCTVASHNKSHAQPLNIYDYIITILWFMMYSIEVIADQQQWSFYQRREQYRSLSKYEQSRQSIQYGDESRGFYTGGLFQYSRHPNFYAEQMLWAIYYLYSISAVTNGVITSVYDIFNWSCIGCILLSLSIFQGSTSLTENITAQKYPTYKLYQQSTSRLIPWFAGDQQWKQKTK